MFRHEFMVFLSKEKQKFVSDSLMPSWCLVQNNYPNVDIWSLLPGNEHILLHIRINLSHKDSKVASSHLLWISVFILVEQPRCGLDSQMRSQRAPSSGRMALHVSFFVQKTLRQIQTLQSFLFHPSRHWFSCGDRGLIEPNLQKWLR